MSISLYNIGRNSIKNNYSCDKRYKKIMRYINNIDLRLLIKDIVFDDIFFKLMILKAMYRTNFMYLSIDKLSNILSKYRCEIVSDSYNKISKRIKNDNFLDVIYFVYHSDNSLDEMVKGVILMEYLDIFSNNIVIYLNKIL